MDVRLQGNSQLHYGGATRNSGSGRDTLKFLSREEQECLQFFEETIESLDDGLDEGQQRLGQRRHPDLNTRPFDSVDGHPSLALNQEVSTNYIIDLVHSEPELHTPDPIYSPTHQDFYHTPESTFDVFPSEYNPPLRSPSFGMADSHSSYHPPGSVPTPVLIAQKIAENQGDGTSNLQPSSLLRRLSMESEKTPKHGPPPSSKPAHYPPNIHVVHGGKEPQIPVANVNIHERQEQMLANLAGSSHPLLQHMEDNTRNSPSRSISFKDPEPDKSRMEALSMLGLTRGRATSLQMIPDSCSQNPLKGPDPRVSSPDRSLTPTAKISTDLPQPNMSIPPPVCFNDNNNTETWTSHSFRSHDERSSHPSSPTMPQTRYPSPPPADITLPAFNTFGGKSIVVHPSLSKNDAPTSPTTPEHKNLPLASSNPIEPHPYGGKSKVVTSANPPVSRTNLPDILSSHIDTRETTPAKPEPPAVEPNKFGGKSRTFDPVSGLYRTTDIRAKPPPPTPAPRPPRHSYYGMLPAQKPPARASSPEYRRRPGSMFRPQGITVQFCGRGAMNESRREALRRLGLLKDS